MRKFVAGAVATLLIMAGGLFLWIGAQGEDNLIPAPPPEPPPTAADDADILPSAQLDADMVGPPPPTPPKAYRPSREELRFNRYDRNRDEAVTRHEMLSSRTKAFKRLDQDGNNLLTFEEWAVATSEKFAVADGDGDGSLTRVEFRSTRPKKAAAKCRC